MFLKKIDTVQFDPADKKHRQAVHSFMKRKAWGDTNIRFTHDPEYGSIAEQVQSKLVRWYLDREMNKVAKTRPAVSSTEHVVQLRKKSA